MKNKKLKFLIIITSILFITFLAVVIQMIRENGECVDGPFEYSAKRLKESGGNYFCSCDSLNESLLDFSFDENGIKIKEQFNMAYTDFDFNNISIVE